MLYSCVNTSHILPYGYEEQAVSVMRNQGSVSEDTSSVTHSSHPLRGSHQHRSPALPPLPNHSITVPAVHSSGDIPDSVSPSVSASLALGPPAGISDSSLLP